jgi:hypothetical protein
VDFPAQTSTNLDRDRTELVFRDRLSLCERWESNEIGYKRLKKSLVMLLLFLEVFFLLRYSKVDFAAFGCFTSQHKVKT